MSFYPSPEVPHIQEVIDQAILAFQEKSRGLGIESLNRNPFATPDINELVDYMHNGGGAPLPGSEIHSLVTFAFVKPLWKAEAQINIGPAAEVELFMMDRMSDVASSSDAKAYNDLTSELLNAVPLPNSAKGYSQLDGVPLRITPIPISFAEDGILNVAAFLNPTKQMQAMVKEREGRACIIFNPAATMLNRMMPTLIGIASKVPSTQIKHEKAVLEPGAQNLFREHVLVVSGSESNLG